MIEAAVNVAIGFALSLCLQAALSHFYGLQTSFSVDLQITLWFTALSLARGYVVRRVFNRGAK
jgi:hypothetical protein